MVQSWSGVMELQSEQVVLPDHFIVMCEICTRAREIYREATLNGNAKIVGVQEAVRRAVAERALPPLETTVLWSYFSLATAAVVQQAKQERGE
jgi:hypothetical protein